MRKLGCNSAWLLGNDVPTNMELIKNAGFDCTFLLWDDDLDIEKYMNKASSIGLEMETFHSPFSNVNAIWEEGEEGDIYTEQLRRCIISASEHDVPAVVIHTTCSSIAPKTSPIGLLRFSKLVNQAEKSRVKLAIENLEFIRHLGLVLDYFKSSYVGFCYDVGHENCYTPGYRFMPLFGDRLVCTHIHDNLGLAPSKDVDYRDDLHRIPFDGAIDYAPVMASIRESGYTGPLTLEVSNRSPYYFYNGLSAEQFYEKAFSVASKLRDMTDGK